MTNWIKCSDELPDDSFPKLISDGDDVMPGFCYEGGWFVLMPAGAEYVDGAITHWAHLPAHPEDAP